MSKKNCEMEAEGLKLQGKVAIVTGGASGIGEATARLFAAQGARAVVIADIQDDMGRSVAESIGSNCCRFFHCDVGDEEQVKALVDWAAESYGRLDIMFSNAGIVGNRRQSILDVDLSVYEDVMRVNARGMLACVKHAARKMVELSSSGGAIVCTASMAAEFGSPALVDYVMSKHAVVGLMQSVVPTLGEHGIRINCVSPSVVPTPILGVGKMDAVKALETMTSLKGTALTVEMVAEAVLFLSSDAAAFITGHNLHLDGGVSVYPLLQAMRKSSLE